MADLAGECQAMVCRGAGVRGEQDTSFTNQAGLSRYAEHPAAGWDFGSGVVEGGCKSLNGAREKGPGMRWSASEANAVAQVRVLPTNDRSATPVAAT